jgi:hypothetical protein
MLQFLHRDNIWQKLKTISRARCRPLFVAVPYLGEDGGKLLSLNRGDVLLVDLNQQNSANGSVCPAEIERLQREGVEVFLAPELHAKVVLSGRKAVVSSANLSRHSFEDLDEAGLLTTDAKVIKEIGNWFQERMGEPVTPEFLRRCAEAYKPPKDGTGPTGRGRIARAPGRRFWLLNIELLEQFPEDEAEVVEIGRTEAESQLSDAKKFKVFPIRWTGKERFLGEIRELDTVIPIFTKANSPYVEEVARLVGIRKTQSRRGVPVTYLYLERSRRPKRISWNRFKRHCESKGLRLGRGVRARELKLPVRRKVLAFLFDKQKQAPP